MKPGIPNRYCLVQFGGRAYGSPSAAKFLRADGEIFFPANDFVSARRKLKELAGNVVDGYQAIDFAVHNAPFRNEAGISKMMTLVSNTERTLLDQHHHNLTKKLIGDLLRGNDVLFSVIVPTNMSVGGSAVMGLNRYSQGVISDADGSYRFVDGEASVNSARGDVVDDYVMLSLDVDGSAWSLDVMVQGNVSVLSSFVAGLTAGHHLESFEQIDVCEECWCVVGDVVQDGDGDGGGSSERRKVCEVSMDQDMCSCLATQPQNECELHISPSPVNIPPSYGSSSSLLPTPTPILLEVNGSVFTSPGGDDVEVVFSSNRKKAMYQCILLEETTPTPPTMECTSPFYAKNLVEGKHSLVVVAKRKGFYGSRRFDFEISSDNDDNEGRPELILREISYRTNVSVTIVIEVKGQVSGGEIRLMCSVGGDRFIPCTRYYYISEGEIGDGVVFVVVGLIDRRSPILGMRHIKKPVPIRTGPVKITNITKKTPDPFGRVEIWFNTSHSEDVQCICRRGRSYKGCNSHHYMADPRVLGAGFQNLSIVCMQYSGSTDTRGVKIYLPPPPPPVQGSLQCDLALMVPNNQGLLVAEFSCDRQINAKCQISGWSATPCNIPIGRYEVDVRELRSGPHLFLLHLEDVAGRSLLKIHPFTIGTAHRRCCPIIDSRLTSIHSNTSHVFLDLKVLPGNCTEEEGFSYKIDWIDGSSEIGLINSLTNISVSKSYTDINTLRAQLNQTSLTVTFCNNPVLQENKCCDIRILPL